MRKRKIKSSLSAALAAAVALSLLSACSSGNRTPTSQEERGGVTAVSATPDVGSNTQNNTQSNTGTPSNTGAPGNTDTPSDTGTVTGSEAYVAMEVQYYDGITGSVIEIPYIMDEGSAASTINGRMDGLLQQYGRFLEPSDTGEWCEVLCYPCESDRYISLVLSENTYPIYGTDGTLTTVVYDKAQRREVTLEDAMALESVSEEDIQSAFGLWAQSWMRSEEEVTPQGGAATARYNGIIGFRMLDDARGEYYVSVTTGREMAGEWMEIYSYRDGLFGKPTDETGTQFLIAADELIQLPLETPLWATRWAAGDVVSAGYAETGVGSTAYVTMGVQRYDEITGSVIEIPYIMDEGYAASEINERMDEVLRQYDRFFSYSDTGEWCEVLCYPCESERYISLVISENIYPIYGTDGTLTTVVYDKARQREFTLEDAMALEGISEEDIQSAFGLWAQSWTRSEEEATPQGGAATARYNGIIGFRMLDDVRGEYYVSVTTGREMAGEWMEIYSYRAGLFGKPTDETGTQFLIAADELMPLPLETPLWAARWAEDDLANW